MSTKRRLKLKPSISRSKVTPKAKRKKITVLKLSGELLEGPKQLKKTVAIIAKFSKESPLIVVHGGGREIDAELARRGIEKRSVDGIRITNIATLSVVTAVLAGTVNTRLVAALVSHGISAIGLTGADDAIGLVEPAPKHRTISGRNVSLGRVGRPSSSTAPQLLIDLCKNGYVPIVASIGTSLDGRLFNVNADTLAGHLAGALKAKRLIIAGTTTGVLDKIQRTIPQLDDNGINSLISSGQAHAGMVAKLLACREAVHHGVGEVIVINGRKPYRPHSVNGTRILRTLDKCQENHTQHGSQ